MKYKFDLYVAVTTSNGMKITFYGGARSVTGANYLLDTGLINPIRNKAGLRVNQIF